METKPTFEQGQLHLQIFEMRREARLRQAREWFFQNYFPENFEQAMRIAPMGTEQGTSVMMVFSYWEQACAFLNHGLLHEDLFFETNGEFYGVWERVKSGIEEGRKQWSNKLFLSNVEKAANRYEKWLEQRSPGALAAMRKFGEQMRAQMTKGKAA
jgi:hypothetical protein